MRSTDKGVHWTNVSALTTNAALPQVPVHCLALDSINPLSTWYAATDNGVYYTIDSGKHWGIAGSGIGLVSCRDIQVHPNKTTIRVATFGRGIWEGSTNALPVELSSLTYKKTKNGTQLLWHTDSEHGDAFFEVERSIDGASFESVSQIPSQATGGNSTVRLDYSFFDSTRHAGTYLYQLKQVDIDGTVHYSNHVELHWGNDQMIVYQNYPNPLLLSGSNETSKAFDPFATADELPAVQPALQTRFSYELPDADVVSIRVYNSSGKLTRTLLNEVQQDGGQQDVYWDGRTDDGNFAASGAYFYTIESKQFGTFIHKMLLLSK